MKRYTVKQLAKLSACPYARCITMTRPCYQQEELLRLQQILLQRELSDSAAARAKFLLAGDIYRQLLKIIDRTIAELERHSVMRHQKLYQGMAPEKQAEYERGLRDRYGSGMQPHIDHSRAKFNSLSAEGRHEAMNEFAELEGQLAESCRRRMPVDSQALTPLLDRHRKWVALMWDRPCSPAAYGRLADLYLAHSDFRTRYETLAPGFCDYLSAAMKTYSDRQVHG